MGISLFFPEYQQFAANVIQNYHHDLSNKLPDITVPSQQIHCQKQDHSLRSSGADTAAHKFSQLRYYRSGGPVVTFEHKGFVGQVMGKSPGFLQKYTRQGEKG